jgi:hypothetical protein
VSWNNQDITGLAANVKERLSEHLSKLKSEHGPPPPYGAGRYPYGGIAPLPPTRSAPSA